MRTSITALSAGLLVAVAANPTWTATLQPKDGSGITGSARVESVAPAMPPSDTAQTPAPNPTSWKATVTISGGKSGSSLAWHIHQGRCGTEGPIVGTEAAYQAISVDDRGNGTGSASLTASLSDRGEYSVAVRGEEGGAVAACGDLKSSAEKTPAGGR